MFAIYSLTVFFILSNLFIIFIHTNNNFSISWMGPCPCLVKIVDFISVLSSTSCFIINLLLLLFLWLYVRPVVSRRPSVHNKRHSKIKRPISVILQVHACLLASSYTEGLPKWEYHEPETLGEGGGLQTAQQISSTMSRCSTQHTEQSDATLALPSHSPPSGSFCETKYFHMVIRSHPSTQSNNTIFTPVL
jgi:hypothetical protein